MIELMLGIAVSASLLAVAVPSAAHMLHAAKVRGARDQFRAMHSLARSSAIRFGRTAELHIQAPSRRFWIEVDTSLTGGVTDTIAPVRELDGVNLEMTSTRSLLCFDARGLASTEGPCQPGNAMIVFSAPGAADTTVTTVLGKVIP